MKFLKYFLGLIFVLVIVVSVIGLFLPASSTVERSIVINASAKTIFPYLNNLKEFSQWSPWSDMDPQMQKTFSGPAAGEGSSMSWSSSKSEVGSGRQTITLSKPYEKVVTELDFDGMGRSIAYFNLHNNGEASELTWGFETQYGVNLVARYMGLFMENWLGNEYQKGLLKLKNIVESLPEIVTREIQYESDGVPLQGYLAYPRDADSAPGVLVVHEWWGHNDYARKRAEMLAELGYAAFALDMYGNGKLAEHPKEANAFMMEVVNGEGVAFARFNEALKTFKALDVTADDQIAAIGYCFGGAVVLSMARAGVDLSGVVSFHGALGGLAPIKEQVNSKFLVLNGAADPFITPEQIVAFKKEMDEAELDYEFINYPNAKHAFTNPAATEKGKNYGIPLEYNEEVDKASWNEMKDFLKTVF